MMCRPKDILVFLSIFLLAGTLSYSQVTLKGEITGIVEDESGEALPGATVVLTGEKLLQNFQSRITNRIGLFRFPEILPGEYEVEVSLDGFNTIKITKIEVSVGQSTPVNAVLSIKKQEEEIVVVGEAPLIETKNTQLSTNYNSETVNTIPNARREFIDLVDATPAVNDYGGAFGGGSERSGQSISNSYRLNGVEVSNPDVGNTWVQPNYDTIEEVQVVGVGASAEYGNFTGATVNVVTKSGGNNFHGGISSYFTNSSLYGSNDGGIEDLIHSDIKYNTEAVGYIGGPIIREKAFFFISGGYSTNETKAYGAPDYGLLKKPNGQIKLDLLPTPGNSLSLMVNMDPRTKENLGLKAGSGPEIAASQKYNTTTYFASWQSIFSENSIFLLKYAGYRARSEYTPVTPDKPYYADYWTGKQFQSAGTMSDHKRNRDEANVVFTHYADDFLGGSHEFKFGLEYENSGAVNIDRATGPDASGFWGTPFLGNTRITAVAGYDIQSDFKMERLGGFFQDNVRLGKNVSLNIGLRLDAPKMLWHEWDEPITSWMMLSPRIGLSYDIKGDAKDVAHVHFGRYYDKMRLYGWSMSVPASYNVAYYSYLYPGYFEPTSENLALLPGLLIQPENLLFVSTGAEPKEVDPDINHGAYTDVFNIGYEKELFSNFALTVDYIYKKAQGMLQINDRTPHTYEKGQWTDPWLGNTLDIWEQVDRNAPDFYYTNSSWTKHRHHFLIISLRKRQVGRWSMMASYTYQNSRGNVDNDDAVALGLWPWGRDNDPYYTENSDFHWGPVTWERPHQFKLLGTVLLPWDICVSGDFRVMSGRPWEPSVFLGTAQAFYRPGSHYMLLEERGSRRTPAVWNTNLRLSKDFHLGQFSNLTFLVDIINVFNKDDGRSYYEEPYAVYPISQEEAFGKPKGLYAPIHLLFGLRWNF